jgi:glycerol-3-phosphate dehydrogenase
MKDYYDIAIIGGGITGLGVAMAAVEKGYNVVILEKSEICKATSNNSLRIIHGGLRYLQSFDFKRSCESIKAQGELLNKFPEHIKPLPCLMPLKKRGLKSKIPAFIGIKVYYFLQLLCGAKPSKNQILSKEDAEKTCSLLKGQAEYGALLWWDAAIDDLTLFVSAIIAGLKNNNVDVLEHHLVDAISSSEKKWLVSGKKSDGAFAVRANSLVDCRGPWVSKKLHNTQGCGMSSHENWCRAFNVIIKKNLTTKYAVAFEGQSSQQGKRLYFVTPRGLDTFAIGTGYLECKDITEKPEISSKELGDFLASFNDVSGLEPINIADVISVEVGILPLRNNPSSPLDLLGASKFLREDTALQVLSTKYTTFLRQGREAISIIRKYLS